MDAGIRGDRWKDAEIPNGLQWEKHGDGSHAGEDEGSGRRVYKDSLCSRIGKKKKSQRICKKQQSNRMLLFSQDISMTSLSSFSFSGRLCDVLPLYASLKHQELSSAPKSSG